MTTMQQFRQGAFVAINDIQLQSAFEGATRTFATNRAIGLAEVPDVEALRDQFKQARAATLRNLAQHLEMFEQQATHAGAQVHWASDGAEARRLVLELAQKHQVKIITKSKSMATEEIHLNPFLEQHGLEVVETDLGEWIIQLAGEPPSHIVGPAIHKTRQQIADLFNRHLGQNLSADDVPGMTAAARQVLREKFLQAGMGISGGNILVAATGSVVLVTNEGNGRLVTSAPPLHVAIVGIEKVAPTWDVAAMWLSLLARSATGQPMSIYTSVVTGAAKVNDPDGPREVHIILLDNGRSRLVGTKYEEVLQCIRCGACLNGCPVYKEAGGHAYGSPYSGPIGAVISPLLFGLTEYEALPQASSLCGECKRVCPVRIDLPRMLLELRADQVAQGIMPWWERLAERAAALGLSSEPFFRFGTNMGRILQRPFVAADHLRLPPSLNPAQARQLPALAPRSFRQMWAEGEI
jgi:L-lactate dehydrogenase complex protein LldF